MSTFVSPVAFTISDTTTDSSTTFLLFTLLIIFLDMSLSIELCCQLYLSKINYSYPIQTVCSKALHNNFSNLISYFHQMIAGTPSSFLMGCSSIISWLVLTTLLAVLNTPHFWSSHYIQIFPNLFPYFTFCLVNSSTSLFFVSRYFFLLIFPCFHSFHSFPFPLTTIGNIIITPPSFA